MQRTNSLTNIIISDFLEEHFGNNPFDFEPTILQLDSPEMFFPPQQNSTMCPPPTQPISSSFPQLIKREFEIFSNLPIYTSNNLANSSLPQLELKTEPNFQAISKQDDQQKQTKKRRQVTRACSSCRKVHTACDHQRPCRRCILYNLECSDPPRKKRQLKSVKLESKPEPKFQAITKKESGTTTPKTKTVPQQTAQAPVGTMSSNTGNKLLNELLQNSKQLNSLSAALPSPESDNPAISLMEPLNQLSEAILGLTQQMAEIRESTKNLESKLNRLSDEVEQVKISVEARTMQLFPRSNNWNEFYPPQEDLSISLWAFRHLGDTKSLILVECNARFKDLLGYPDQLLKNNFSADRLLNWQQEICPHFHEGMKIDKPAGDCLLDPISSKTISFRTQINVASGVKDAMITIHPICSSNQQLKYFLMHILEVQKN